MVLDGTYPVPGPRYWSVLLVLALGVATLPRPVPALAHCDSINGPVASAARQALEAGNVNLILPYVKVEAERELATAFQHVLAVRGLGEAARALADRFFMETAVRLHRAGEGAPYTGLQEETAVSPALAAADQALQTGSLEGVHAVLDAAIRLEVARQYQAILAAREHAAREGTVAAARERLEAELAFETYIDALYEAAAGRTLHAEIAPSLAERMPNSAVATC
jgi:hypothetical protein